MGPETVTLTFTGLVRKRCRGVAKDPQKVLGWELENVSVDLGVSTFQLRSRGFEHPPRYAAVSPQAVTNFRA
jgi:hypothetical protein